ncbi:transaldolase [Acidomonas methanolica]|uniref:transaldolase n=1 Tax=Acidomonas methanolica TaxID=437 RepID=UPI00211A071B|nr:transaldolase [Acidomonas methanolica]MCQ9155932.1 transaldolase [Acidomonas methanolica]
MAQRYSQTDAGRFEALLARGQSPWLDYINRTHTESGSLRKMVEQDGLQGMTSNPAIFEKTMGYGNAYDAQIRSIVSRKPVTPEELYEELAVTDIRAAADVLRPVYDGTNHFDGHVSIEVSPYIANDAEATIKDSRRLWRAVDLPNVMIKIPGNAPGAKAIEEATFEGINVNVTLLFEQAAYQAVLEAYIRGLERRVEAGLDVKDIASVSSFYISRVDVLADSLIDRKIAAGEGDVAALKALRGKVAVANAKLAYEHWEQVTNSARWQRLAEEGAQPQRLLWASTGSKDPTYRDVRYVEELVAPETVNTMPLETYDAFRDHGEVTREMARDYGASREILRQLHAFGIDLKAVTDQLLREGLDGFEAAFVRLHNTLERKIAESRA